MIIGTAESLQHLGAQLMAAGSVQESARFPDWPPVVASPRVSGPYLNEPGFALTFNVLQTAHLSKSLALRRRGVSLWLALVVGGLALIGTVALIGWVL